MFQIAISFKNNQKKPDQISNDPVTQMPTHFLSTFILNWYLSETSFN